MKSRKLFRCWLRYLDVFCAFIQWWWDVLCTNVMCLIENREKKIETVGGLDIARESWTVFFIEFFLQQLKFQQERYNGLCVCVCVKRQSERKKRHIKSKIRKFKNKKVRCFKLKAKFERRKKWKEERRTKKLIQKASERKIKRSNAVETDRKDREYIFKTTRWRMVKWKYTRPRNIFV